MEPLIEVRDLSRHFSSGLFRPRLVRAVDRVSFSVAPGETFGVMGESGCGKSTLARLLARLLPPTAGTIRLDGIDLSAASGEQLRRLRRRIQIIFQDAEGTLDPRMRVRDLLLEPLRVHGLLHEPEPTAIDRLLGAVNLTPDLLDRFPHQLSGGQRQRLGVARATCLDPDFIVLDEPAASLDLSIQAQVLANLSQRQRDRGTGYLLITHNLTVLRLLAQRVAVMYLGRFVEVGTAAEIFDRPRHPYTQALISSMGRRTGARNAAPVGEPPSPLDPPTGCAFHPRCPRAETVCRETPPALLGERRLVACHLAVEPDARRPAHSSTSGGGPAAI
ncbi:MAG: oligopeptide/dipeptide ABC transporter ATP-binding protein [Pseudonocardia sp.]